MSKRKFVYSGKAQPIDPKTAGLEIVEKTLFKARRDFYVLPVYDERGLNRGGSEVYLEVSTCNDPEDLFRKIKGPMKLLEEIFDAYEEQKKKEEIRKREQEEMEEGFERAKSTNGGCR